MRTKHFLLTFLIFTLTVQITLAARAPLQTIATEPYASAIVLDADTGKTLFAKNADDTVYPASALKLMVLLVILEQIEQGKLQLDDMVQVTEEAYKMGGSQVYLDPKEQFSIEDLLYALMIQSANDAAVALASHVAGSKEAFVVLMNKKAKELGMKNTQFHSVHGLPPSKGQKVDVTTARDFGILSRHLSLRPEVFKYTGTRVRDFRGGEFIMRTHNHLLKNFDGCDGFKTGYFAKAGFSIAATAKRNGVRLIAIVMGSKNRKIRDATATELLNTHFSKIPARAEAPIKSNTTQIIEKNSIDLSESTPIMPAVTNIEVNPVLEEEDKSSGWIYFFIGVGVGFLLYAVLNFLRTKRRNKSRWRSKTL